MYVPSAFAETRPEGLADFIAANAFAAFVTNGPGGLVASHVPLLHDAARGILSGHLARANPQGADLVDGAEALAIFTGPHAYVSPRWYARAPAVPTWNYTAVHAYGLPKIISERERKYQSQRRLVAAMDPQWLPAFDKLAEKYVTAMLEGIVNFEIAVTRIETRWKLSQNRSKREMELIAAQLEKSRDSVEQALGSLTRKHLPRE
jgi:transcriptional regulator